MANALGLLRRAELDPDGLLIARAHREVLGAILCLPVAGASGLIWPPQARADSAAEQIEDELVQAASMWLRRKGAKLGQTLLPREEMPLAAPLERNGFRHVTRLWYLRHDLGTPQRDRARLDCRAYDPAHAELFQQTLQRSYVDSLDCPEVSGVRDLAEILEGHRAQGVHNPDRWWLALLRGQPVGVLLLTDMPEWGGWDLSYVGVVPEARGQGIGRELTRKALFEAQAARAAQLTLAVDARNTPAWNLYTQLGFEPYDAREVYLAIWKP